ncbi:hypothetical protein Droror1_Dr00002530 [Drosera rotundifolia]
MILAKFPLANPTKPPMNTLSHSLPPILSMSFPTRHRHTRRHTRRRLNPHPHQYTTPPPPSPTTTTSDHLRLVIDPSSLKHKTLTILHSKLESFISSGSDAIEDIRTLVTVDSRERIIVSCKGSTVRFLGEAVVLGFVGVVVVRWVAGLWWKGRGEEGVVVKRRDRSLGGREVVVGVRERRGKDEVVERRVGERREEKRRRLPEWWPVETGESGVVVEGEEREMMRRAANRLVRAILDDRIGGKDISDDDIIRLRELCRKSGAKVSFDSVDARDSFYRLAVEFVLTMCSKVNTFSQLVDEDPRSFLVGLADNIGLSSSRASVIVAAVVAARTRLWFLQAWALEMRGKHSDALEELSKICIVHQIFPPEPSSPEMELVARGLEKHLRYEQREFLLKALVGACGEGSRRSAAEALGLVHD